jgi:hypothetical protein
LIPAGMISCDFGESEKPVLRVKINWRDGHTGCGIKKKEPVSVVLLISTGGDITVRFCVTYA